MEGYSFTTRVRVRFADTDAQGVAHNASYLVWFEVARVEYLRAYPSALIAAPPLEGAQLFEPAGDDWALERWLAQLGWMAALAHEGGLFVTIGRAAPSTPPPPRRAAA